VDWWRHRGHGNIYVFSIGNSSRRTSGRDRTRLSDPRETTAESVPASTHAKQRRKARPRSLTHATLTRACCSTCNLEYRTRHNMLLETSPPAETDMLAVRPVIIRTICPELYSGCACMHGHCRAQSPLKRQN
jgi:hypothetical protein